MTDYEIEAFLAEHVMKWTLVKGDNDRKTPETVFMIYEKGVYKGTPYVSYKVRLPEDEKLYPVRFERWWPTKSLADAFEMVDNLRKKFSYFCLFAGNGWGAEFWNIDDKGNETQRCRGTGETKEEAICKAAMAVVEYYGEDYSVSTEFAIRHMKEKMRKGKVPKKILDEVEKILPDNSIFPLDYRHRKKKRK